MAVEHYENFPVASLLCPPALRPPIAAIYHFARTADDIADEGNEQPVQRLALLALYRNDLHSALKWHTHSGRWPQVFDPLPAMVEAFELPVPLLEHLISAFEQDVRYTAQQHRYADRAELLAYCKLSANPVGRLLLHLYGIHDADSLERSDRICTALQLINFWQDLSVDIPRGRHYLPLEACAALGLDHGSLLEPGHQAKAMKIVAREAQFARSLMHKGQSLATSIPGRAGWELRLVVQGGLRILDKIAAMNFGTLHARPRLRFHDLPIMLWRALRM